MKPKLNKIKSRETPPFATAPVRPEGVERSKRSKEEIRRDAQLYVRLLNSLDCIVWEADAKTFQFSFVSPQAERMLGYPAEQWLSPGFWAQHVHPEDVEWSVKFCQQATKQGRDHEFEYRMIAADGRIVWLHDVVSVEMAPAGAKLLTGVMLDITEKKHVEEALRRSKDELRHTFDVIPQQIWSGSPEGLIDFCNDRWLSDLGMTQEDLQSDGWRKILHPDDRQRVLAAWQESVLNGTPYELETRLRMRDGQYRWFLARGAPLRDEEGLIVRWYGSNTDIDDRRRAEDALRCSKDELRNTIDAIPGQIFTCPPDGSLDFGNARFRSDTGMTLEELRGNGWIEMIHPDDLQRVLNAWNESMLNGTPYEQEDRHRMWNGQYRWFLCRAVPLRDTEGRIVRWYGTSTDIDEQKRVQDALRESEERFRTIFENAGLGVALVDGQGRLVKTNPALQRMICYTEDELRGKVFTDFTHPENRDRDWRMYKELAALKRDTYTIEQRAIRKDGQVIIWRVTVSPVKNKDGTRAEYMVAMVEDITERRRAESLVALQKDILELVAQARPLTETLETLVRLIELQSPGMLGSILLLDEDGQHTRHGAGPSLPEQFVKAIDGAVIGPNAGSCGAAMYRKEAIIVADVMQDPLWKDYRDLAAAHGLRASWSTPILSSQGNTLGSFAMYYPEPRSPSAAEMGVIGVATNLAAIAIERSRSEESLRESEARFRAIFENAGTAMGLQDRHGRILKCNPAGVKMAGYSEDELRQMAFTDLMPQEDREWEWELFSELMAGTRDTYDIEKRVIKKDGESRLIRLIKSAVRNRNGEPEYAVTMAEDITDRKRAEQELQRAGERLREAIDAIPEQIWSGPPDGTSDFCNLRFLSEVGLNLQDIQGDGWQRVIHPDDRDRVLKVWRESVANGTPYEQESRRRMADGKFRWFLCRGVPVRGADGRVERWYGSNTDITERKRAEKELKVAHEELSKELAELTQADAEIQRLSERLINAQEEERTRIARELHDHVSQQIAALGISLSNIKREIPADRQEARKQAEGAYGRLLAIAEDIRNLSHELHPAILEHSGLVAALKDCCTESESLTKLNITVRAQGRFDDLPANVQLGIYRIAQEALQNIWKHSGVKKGIIHLARNKERVQVRISDEGIGFDSAQLSKMRGLGLVSMRERARLLGATFNVESSLGDGTTIIADIPLGSAARSKERH